MQNNFYLIQDLLFCPDFTVIRKTKAGPVSVWYMYMFIHENHYACFFCHFSQENPDDLSSLDSCEYIWLGFDLLACFSMYLQYYCC